MHIARRGIGGKDDGAPTESRVEDSEVSRCMIPTLCLLTADLGACFIDEAQWCSTMDGIIMMMAHPGLDI